MEEKKLVPKRRFEEYVDEWKKYHLGERVKFITGLTYSPNDIVNSKGILVIRSSNIQNNQVVDADNVYVNPKVVNSDKVNKGDIIVVVRNGSRHLIGKNAVVRKQMANTVIGAFMTGIRTKQYDFVGALLNTKLFKRQITENLGATINQITLGMFWKFSFYFPSEKEQQKIGKFFRVLDERIANQERKIAKVKALKEAYLAEMFPQEGETVPKRRFKGFKGEWNNDILGNILDYEQPTNYIVESDQYNESYPTPVLTAGQSFILGYTNEKVGIKKANDNNPVIIFDDFTTGSHYVNFPFKVKSSALKILSAKIEKVLPYFSYLLLENLKYEPESHERHWISIYSHFNILLPTIEEQEKICTFFKNIDNQIEAEEAKLEKLKQMKEAYLEEMFV